MITIWFVTETAKLHFIYFFLPLCPGINLDNLTGFSIYSD